MANKNIMFFNIIKIFKRNLISGLINKILKILNVEYWKVREEYSVKKY